MPCIEPIEPFRFSRSTQPTKEELTKCPFRGLFIDGKELDIAEILFNYFQAVKRKWPKSWDAPKGSKNLLPKSNAFKALMKFLKEDVYPGIVGINFGRVPKVEQFRPYFDNIEVRDNDFTARNFAPGSGGQSVFLRLLRGEITIDELVEEE